jgi:hypothetical protein
MGTHAMIGIWDEDTNEVTASYVHYDGYVEGVGALLVASYNDHYRATVVATGGYLSSLVGSYIESRAAAVHSDKAVTFASVEDYFAEGFEYAGAQYLYLWDGEAWFVSVWKYKADNTPFESVEMNLVA